MRQRENLFKRIADDLANARKGLYETKTRIRENANHEESSVRIQKLDRAKTCKSLHSGAMIAGKRRIKFTNKFVNIANLEAHKSHIWSPLNSAVL